MASFVSLIIATLLAVDRSLVRAQLSFATSSPNATAGGVQIPKTYGELYRQIICENQRSCHLVGNVSDTERTLAVRNCMCDEECNTYGDCCFDSQSYDEADQKTNFGRFYCPKEEWYVKASCAPQFVDRDVISKCADGARGGTSDRRIITPVTDVELKLTYANVFCAICDNRDPRSESIRLWNVTFRCEATATATETATAATAATVADRLEDADALAAVRDASWDEALNAYRAYFRGRAYKCEALRRPPTDVAAGLRRCAAVVSSCPAAAKADLAAKCESFSLFVHDDAASYRNVFCALCNNVTRPLSGCRPQIEDRFSTPQRLFSVSNKATGNAACSDPNANPDLKKRFCSS